MTADLPALLQRARQLMPERVPEATGQYARVRIAGGDRCCHWTHTSEYQNTLSMAPILPALIEELEARGWDWHTHNTGPREFRRHCAQVYPNQSALSGMFQAYAPTPAEALLSALLSALAQHEAQA